jgi:ElaA protein
MTASNWYQFNDLTPTQLYDILQLRELVFTIGQQCSEPDIDDVDRTAMHYVKYDGDKLVAYLRVYSADNQLKLGRIVVHPEQQGKGLGKGMMVEVVEYLRCQHPDKGIEMSAQYYLQKFYQALGFETVSDIYLEAGIEHVYMRFAPIN